MCGFSRLCVAGLRCTRGRWLSVACKPRSNLLFFGTELHVYGRALSQWNQQFASKMELLTNSYADAYRVQLHRIEGEGKSAIDSPQLEADLARPKNWTSEDNSGEMQNVTRRA